MLMVKNNIFRNVSKKEAERLKTLGYMETAVAVSGPDAKSQKAKKESKKEEE